MTEFQVYEDPAVLAEAVASEIVSSAEAAIAARGQFALALAGGSTPRRTYRLLASLSWVHALDGSRVHIFWGDERCVPPGHPESNYRMAWEAMLQAVPIPRSNIHRIAGEREPREAAAAYASVLRRVLGADLRLDMILLGMGADGHTASLFPETPAPDVIDRPVTAVYVPEYDRWRITLTLPALNAGRQVAFLVQGAAKAEALARVRVGADVPAGRVEPGPGDVVWFVDEAAAARAALVRDA